jgi:hypothetical protein
MFQRTVLLFIAALLLSGCILQSPKPNFSEAEGKLLLGKNGGTYVPYTKEKSGWKIDGEEITFSVSGNSYALKNSEKLAPVKFVSVTNSWWIAQFHEGKNATYYVLIDVQADALYVHPLSCKDIKRALPAINYVTYKNDDCFLKPGTPAKSFVALIATAGARTNKWVLKK